MLHFLHHPAGNIVIRTNNPYIVLQYQNKGWLSATSLDEVIAEHPEWQDFAPSCTATIFDAPAQSFAAILCSTLFSSLSATLALVPSYSPTGVLATAPLLAQSSPADSTSSQHAKSSANAGPLHWLTAVERKWWWRRGHSAPIGSWIMCMEGDEAFDYRLEDGMWELEMPPEYEASVGRRGDER